MIYESRAVNLAAAMMIAGAICLSPIGLAVYFAVCVGVIFADRRRTTRILKGDRGTEA